MPGGREAMAIWLVTLTRWSEALITSAPIDDTMAPKAAVARFFGVHPELLMARPASCGHLGCHRWATRPVVDGDGCVELLCDQHIEKRKEDVE